MNIILTKILPTNDHRKGLTIHLDVMNTNAANVSVNPLPLPVLEKSVIAAKNQSAKRVTNAANLTAAANLKDAVSQITKLIANRTVNTNVIKIVVSAENLKKLFSMTVANALSSKYVRASSTLQSYVHTYNVS
jgi:hypothetical protein